MIIMVKILAHSKFSLVAIILIFMTSGFFFSYIYGAVVGAAVPVPPADCNGGGSSPNPCTISTIASSSSNPSSSSLTSADSTFTEVLAQTSGTNSPSDSSANPSSSSLTSADSTFTEVLAQTSGTNSPSSSSVNPSSSTLTSADITSVALVSSNSAPTISNIVGTDQAFTSPVAVSTSSNPAPTTNTVNGVVSTFTSQLAVTTSSNSAPTTTEITGKSLQINQILLAADTTEFSFNPNDGLIEIIITSAGITLNVITVPNDVDDAIINGGDLLNTEGDGRKSLTFANGFMIDAVVNNLNFDVEIPDGIKIFGPSTWNGVINLPTAKETSSINLGTGTVTSVIEIGLDDTELTFDKPVRLVFEGKANENVSFERGGVITEITTVCDDDDITAVTNQLGGSGDCKTTSNNDRIVWVFHFTKFFTFTPPTPATTPIRAAASTPSVSFGGGGGGGGGVGVSNIPGEAPPTITPFIQGGATFTTVIDNKNFVLNYKMPTESASITGVTVDRTGKSATFSLNNIKAGPMQLSIPRGLVDATGDAFQVFVTASPETQIEYEIVTSTADYVTIEMELPDAATQLRVKGTIVLPEATITGVKIYEVSWDICDANMVSIVVGPPLENLSVKLRTTSGLITPSLAENQPYGNRLVFESSLPPGTDFMLIQAETVVSRNASLDQKSVNLNECTGLITFAQPPFFSYNFCTRIELS